MTILLLLKFDINYLKQLLVIIFKMPADIPPQKGIVVSNNWSNYQKQIHKYLSSIESNPYVLELSSDFKKLSVFKIVKYMTSEYSVWVNKCYKSNIFTPDVVNIINSLFNTDILLKQFVKHFETTISVGNTGELLHFITPSRLEKLKIHIQSTMPVIKFNPSELKFVTTTGLAILDTTVDFAFLYKHFTPPINIVKPEMGTSTSPLFYPEVINTVIGCKTGNLPVKGFFKKADVGDFYNCATLQIVLGERKCANIKLFNNGKLQLTGIPHPDLGPVAVKIICDLIKSIPDDKETGNKIVFDKKRVTLKEYKTVMINTCYDLKISIDRDITSSILHNRYNFNTVWEGDGYPGVRVLYYYNTDTVGTENDGICMCSENNTSDTTSKSQENLCSGKGSGSGEYNCRKISIAVFQSGKIIIAGGCQEVKPIYNVYHRFNNIIAAIMPEIQKLDDGSVKKSSKQKANKIFLEIARISNFDEYANLLT